MLLCVLFLAIFLILWIRFRNEKKEYFNKLPKKGNELKILYPVSYGILSAVSGRIHISEKNRRKKIEQLNVTEDYKETEVMYNVKRVALSLFIIIAVSILGILYRLSVDDGRVDYYLDRPSYGEQKRTYEITINNEDASVEINPREYTAEEAMQQFEKAYDTLVVLIKGDNSDLSGVDSGLNLVTVIPDTGISVQWLSSDTGRIDNSGKIYNEDMLEGESCDVVLTAMLKSSGYECSYDIDVTVVAPNLTPGQAFVRKALKKIRENEINERTGDKVTLPRDLENKEIKYRMKTEDYTVTLVILGLITAVAVFFAMDKEMDRRLNARSKQMLSDYSEIVSKLNILSGAGMSILRAWEKIVKDYEEGMCDKNRERRYAYEEMRITYYEIKSGISESNAYSDFGRRCNIHEYLKLGALLEQNVRKGAKGLSVLLEAEARNAFEQRKNLAKKLGEEAGTKMLLPMILMLMIVMVIVLIPAFTSFGV